MSEFEKYICLKLENVIKEIAFKCVPEIRHLSEVENGILWNNNYNMMLLERMMYTLESPEPEFLKTKTLIQEKNGFEFSMSRRMIQDLYKISHFEPLDMNETIALMAWTKIGKMDDFLKGRTERRDRDVGNVLYSMAASVIVNQMRSWLDRKGFDGIKKQTLWINSEDTFKVQGFLYEMGGPNIEDSVRFMTEFNAVLLPFRTDGHTWVD